MSMYLVRFSRDYSITVEADSAEAAVKLAPDLDSVDWDWVESDFEAELVEET